MKITFINPNLDGAYLPNFGLAYVISAVEKDHQVRLLDMSFRVKGYAKYILSDLKRFKPDVIGFSVTSFTFCYALRIAALVRNVYPDIPLIYGGVQCTLLPKETIQNHLVDAICIGEGEDALGEYLQKFSVGQEPKGVTGIWYKDKTGAIFKNPLRPFRQDLDSLPFPNWDHWEIENYLKLNESFIGGLRIFASRGCPYYCTFCSNPAIDRAVPGTFYRLRSPENIVQEIKFNVEKYYNKGFRQVVFADENFGLDLRHMEDICSLYVKEGLSRSLGWSCQTRVERITEEWVQIANSAGCNMLSFGIESGDEHIRMEVYNKKITDEQIKRAVKILRKHSIICGINIIVGCPQDSRESINKSFKLIREINPIPAAFTFYNPLPETTLYNSLNLNIDYTQEGPWRIWNVPKLTTRSIGIWGIRLLALRIYFFRLFNFLAQGLRLRKIGFFRDILKYIFQVNSSRAISLLSPHIVNDIEARTIYKYILEDYQNKK